VQTDQRCSRDEFEYELLDTGVFEDDRYFDVFVEYAKADPEDVLIKISVCNRGPEAVQIRNGWTLLSGRVKAPICSFARVTCQKRFFSSARVSA
jgi:hypothetical protein